MMMEILREDDYQNNYLSGKKHVGKEALCGGGNIFDDKGKLL